MSFSFTKMFFRITVSFSYIYISQGSVATQMRCGGMFNNFLIAHFRQNALVK